MHYNLKLLYNYSFLVNSFLLKTILPFTGKGSEMLDKCTALEYDGPPLKDF